MRLSHLLMMVGILGSLTACATPQEGAFEPVLNPVTATNKSLRHLPPPEKPVAVAVYDYSDQTGQFKASDNVQTLSKAVTQGAAAILIKALQDAGDRRWFTVIERQKLDNLLKERKIIKEMRRIYLGEEGINKKALPPLLFAGMILEGGIIGYDTNTITGGAGARYLGIGGDVKYRQDTVTVYLRAVSTKTGEVLVNVTSHKTIASYGVRGDAFKFVSIDKLLEAEAGITKNEPDQLAVQQAIEKVVYALIIEGADLGLWAFSDPVAQRRLVSAYREEKNGTDPSGPTTDQTADVEKQELFGTKPTAAIMPAPPSRSMGSSADAQDTAWRAKTAAVGNAPAIEKDFAN